jgi:DNA (cytosine-5)-methyltransferase 1
LSLGLHNAGWKGLFAIEKSPDAFKTLKHNLIDKYNHFDWPKWLPQTNLDIKIVLKQYAKHLTQLRGKVTMVTGGPPCQGFSTAGKRDEKDKRNKLIHDYMKFIELVQPELIFFENVKGFTLEFTNNEKKGKRYSLYVLRKLDKLGYNVCGNMVDFSEYGVPQKRCRFILAGIRKDVSERNQKDANLFFQQINTNKKDFLLDKNLDLAVTLKEAISDLLKTNGTVNSPDTKNFKAGVYSAEQSGYQIYIREGKKIGGVADSHRFVNHTSIVEDRFQWFLDHEAKNKVISKKARKKYNLKKRTIIPLSGDTTSPTLTTLPDDYIHYSEPRIFTVREYARLQTFPDSFEFQGKYTTGGKLRKREVPRYTQIGNAIPPLFGEQSGNALKQLIS